MMLAGSDLKFDYCAVQADGKTEMKPGGCSEG